VVGCGNKVIGHVGEGDGVLRGGRTVGARENRRWICRARVAALASKHRRKGEGGMGKGRPVGLALRGKEGGASRQQLARARGEWRTGPGRVATVGGEVTCTRCVCSAGQGKGDGLTCGPRWIF
jgi:hypothetical protein